jgi:hypothetical protein
MPVSGRGEGRAEQMVACLGGVTLLAALCSVGECEMNDGGLLRRFARNERGNVLITFALAIVVLLGAAGLGTEVAAWYSSKRDMQNAADLAAASGAMSLKVHASVASSTTDGYARTTATSTAAAHGFIDGVNNVIIASPSIPPQTGPYSGAAYNHLAIEVIVQKPAPLLFSGLFLPSGPTIGARAVGLIDYSKSTCVKVMHPGNAPQTFQLSGSNNGGGTMNIQCPIEVDSTAAAASCANNGNNGASSAAAYINGSSTVTATALYVAGNACVTGSGAFNIGTYTPGYTPQADPYASWSMPSPSGNNNGSYSDANADTNTLQPGIYSSITINGNATLSPGTYFVEGGNVTVNGSIVSAPGVTIVLTHATGSTHVGTFNMGNSATANITAPTSGSTAGMAIVQDPSAQADGLQNGGNSYTCDTSTNCNSITGSSTASIVGALYFPEGWLTYQGGATTTSSGCLQIIADRLTLSGNPNIHVNGCAGTGVTLFGAPAVLAE